VFLLQVVAEVYVGLSVLRVFVGPTVPLWVLCAVAGTVFIGYSVIGGLPAIMITDHIKYRLITFGLLLAAIMLFDQGGASAVRLIQGSFSTTFLPTSSASCILLLSLIALNLPLLITDMSVWQRVGAAESEKEVTRGLGSFAAMLLPWLAMIVFIGIGFGSFLVPPEGYTTAQAILSFFSDSLVIVFLLAGLFAALLTTADNYLIASVQTILVDWVWAERLERVSYRPEDLPRDEQRSMLRTAEVGVVVLGFGSVVLGYLFLAALPNLLDLLFVVFGIQAALTPSVVWGLLGKARPSDARAGIASLVAGGVTGLLCLFLALGGIELLGVSYGLWSPVFVLAISSIIFLVLRRTGTEEVPPVVTV
jgi:solute:Na+ symporter, SSS family